VGIGSVDVKNRVCVIEYRYEMLIGVTPFYNRNRNMLLMKIKNSKVIFPDKSKYKIEYSDEIESLINSVPILPLTFFHSC
jgi:hypothetical protein